MHPLYIRTMPQDRGGSRVDAARHRLGQPLAIEFQRAFEDLGETETGGQRQAEEPEVIGGQGLGQGGIQKMQHRVVHDIEREAGARDPADEACGTAREALSQV